MPNSITKTRFQKFLKNSSFPIFIDGGMGTCLQEKIANFKGPSEIANIKYSQQITDIHKNYLMAGAKIITTNTFGASRIKLSSFNLEDKLIPFNTTAVDLAKQAILECRIENALVAGDIGPTGDMLYPLGNLSFQKVSDNYFEQAVILDKQNVDLFIIETFTDLLEIKAAIHGVRRASNKPVFASMSFTSGQRTLTGNTPESAFISLQAMDIDAVGINCGYGPLELKPILARALKYAYKPVFFQANAGVPKSIDNQTVFHETPTSFANAMTQIASMGIEFLGGCCGTTPNHIREMIKVVPINTFDPLKPFSTRLFDSETRKKLSRSLAGMNHVKLYGQNQPFMIIGEKINPTGKKKLTAEFKQGITSKARKLAIEQKNCGADAIDINVGVPGVNELNLMKNVLTDVSQPSISGLPVCIDSKDINVIQSAIELFRGKPLLNSFTGDLDQIETGLSICKNYGCAAIFLTLTKTDIPKSTEARLKIVDLIFKLASEMNVPYESIIIDPLVMPLANPENNSNNLLETNNSKYLNPALTTLETLKNIKIKWPEANTSLGISNISFGLPRRDIINSAFLTMAIQNGLDMGIINPLDKDLTNAVSASNFITSRSDFTTYLQYLDSKGIRKKEILISKTSDSIQIKNSFYTIDPIYKHFEPDLELNNFERHIWDAILNGDTALIKKILSTLNNDNPQTIIDNIIIPAIKKTGDLYAKNIIYLPSMVKSAQAVKTAMSILEPMLSSEMKLQPKGKILLATVQEDVHDIGKNIVALFLKNNGYIVIDLGKDVPNTTIVSKVESEKPDFLALSALMTTTMKHMKTINNLLNKAKIKIPMIIGGACVDKDFADSIGAYYAADPTSAISVLDKINNTF